MNRRCAKAGSRKVPAKAVGTTLGAAEHECLIAALLQEMDEQIALSVMWNSMNTMRHCSGSAVWSRHLNLRRIDHELDCERPDRIWKCGGEQHGLPLFWQGIEDSPQRRQEPHVHHSIGLVDHQDFDCG